MQSRESQGFLAVPERMPFCKGCGHTLVLRRLDAALTRSRLRPADVCLVTDIGCIGLADARFDSVHTVHTTHGRSTGFAAGIQLADGILFDRRLRTVVLIGDGGAMIGLQHLVHAAHWNIDVTVLLCNNFLYGMTGGQNSAFSPCGFVTPTTPSGSFVPPLDACRVLQAAGAGFVSRTLATARDLTDEIAAAIEHPGFAVVEIVELCTEHGTSRNEIQGRHLEETLQRHDQALGRLVADRRRPDFSRLYSDTFPRPVSGVAPGRATPGPLEAPSSSPEAPGNGLLPARQGALSSQVGIILAGSAGERVQSAARQLCEAAMRCGLHCTQKNDNPVTQGSGFSLAEVVLSPRPILYTGIEAPAAVLVVSADGLGELHERDVFATMPPEALLLLDTSLEVPSCRATVQRHPFRKREGGALAAWNAVLTYVESSGVLPLEEMTAL